MKPHDFANAKPIARAWGLYFGERPCEAYAVQDSKVVSGDGDDIIEHVRAGGSFLTYEGFASELEAQSGMPAAAGYNVRPLPVGSFFYIRGDLHIVRGN